MKEEIAVVILAAGGSRRLGSPKQLLPYRGKAMLRHVAETALSADFSRVFVVVGAHGDLVRAVLTGLPLEIVANDEWEQGMSTSLRAGIMAVERWPACQAALLAVGDQPLVSAALLQELAQTAGATGKPLVASYYAGTAGVPALFARAFFPSLKSLTGDKGAKAVLQRHAQQMATVPFPQGEIDIDTAEDYRKLQFTVTEWRKIMENCIFCKIVQKQIPAQVVYEDAETIAFLDIKPVNPGHTLVIPKKHHVNIFDIDEAAWKNVAATVRKVASAVQKATGGVGINLGMNNEPGAGQLVMHAHVHVMPRRADDKFRLWPGKEQTPGDLQKMGDKIRQGIEGK